MSDVKISHLGRPRSKGILRNTTIYFYESYGDLYAKAASYAATEGISFSELVSKALADYLKIHYPGNPQIPLDACRSARVLGDYMEKNLMRRIKKLSEMPLVTTFQKEIFGKGLEECAGRLAKLRKPSEETVKAFEALMLKGAAIEEGRTQP